MTPEQVVLWCDENLDRFELQVLDALDKAILDLPDGSDCVAGMYSARSHVQFMAARLREAIEPSRMVELTREMVEDLKTARGGYTKRTITALGIAWPPRTGWKRRLCGTRIPVAALERARAGSGRDNQTCATAAQTSAEAQASRSTGPERRYRTDPAVARADDSGSHGGNRHGSVR